MQPDDRLHRVLDVSRGRRKSVPDGDAPSPFVDPDRAHGRDGIAGGAVIARLVR
jgi:hypothetical protein